MPLPSLFFIGKNGTPLEIVTGATRTVEELEKKIDNVLEKVKPSSAPSGSNTSADLIASKLLGKVPQKMQIEIHFAIKSQTNVQHLLITIRKSYVRMEYVTNVQRPQMLANNNPIHQMQQMQHKFQMKKS